MTKNTPLALYWPHLQNSYFFHPNDFEDGGINDNQMGLCLVNMVGGASFPIQTVPAFGMSSSLYVAELMPDRRTPFVLKPKMVSFSSSTGIDDWLNDQIEAFLLVPHQLRWDFVPFCKTSLLSSTDLPG
ncbi:Hypothetical predicted protein [Octopus vulgaris]|uniref:Uncharacterized protein n=1 Tax=Octopus vulgaris TaxID=6645 RepID=A0AA36EW49_OCTVU|nr:Hypothetical predicted protein [Octopus vulgaris]